MSRECATLVVMFVMWSSTFVSSEECERREFTAKFTVTCNSPPFSRELDYCIPGQKVNEPCSSDNVCGYCPDGQYQHVYTNCKTCIPCTTLENCSNGQVLIRNCESASNAVCGCPRCPEVRCPTQPSVTCPPVPNTTCEPCLPCPTEPDITTTLERTCPPCPAAEEKNPTSPSDDKPFTCPPVEPCPTPGYDPLVSSLEHELMLWKIGVIIAFAVTFLGLLFAYLLLYCCKADCLKKLCPHAHARFVDPENGNHKQPHRNCADLENQDPDRRACGGEPVGNNQNDNGELLAAGGTKQEVAPDSGNDKNGTNVRVKIPAVGTSKDREAPNSSQSPPKEDEVHIRSPEVEDSGDEHDGSDEAKKPLLEVDKKLTGAQGGIPASEDMELRNMPKNSPDGETSASPQSMSTNYENAPMKKFSRPELGEEKVQEKELVSIAEELYDNYWGQSFTSLPLLLSKLGFETKFYSKVLADFQGESIISKIFQVLLRFQEEKSCDRNYYRRLLRNVSADLSDWFVDLINEENSIDDNVVC